jgi:hypothetical protein
MLRVKFILVLAASLLFAAPAFSKTIDESQLPPSHSRQILPILHKWNAARPIPLKEHQLRPIDYLEGNTQKGLLVYHEMGSGKTLIGIGFAERNPGRPVIILAPPLLEGPWLAELNRYGVKDKSRYRFVSHDTPHALSEENLSNAIIILDESHKFIERVRSLDSEDVYSQLYLNLRNAHRVLALSGTPVYQDMFDLVYQINLVAGQDELLFNQEEFRVNYLKINAFKSYWRGHLLESLYLPRLVLYPLMPFIGGILFKIGLPFTFATIGSVVPLALYSSVTTLLPIHHNPIREFNPKQLTATIQKYVSYYSPSQDISSYPSKSVHLHTLNYNEPQLNMLYQFYDSRLPQTALDQIRQDWPSFKHNNKSARKIAGSLHSSSRQNVYKRKPGAGREIGNLSFIHKDAWDQIQNNQTATASHFSALQLHTIFPEKFERILHSIKKNAGPTVVYSHYDKNGLQLFKQFLDAAGYQGKYEILEAGATKEESMRIIEEYNRNKIEILFLHPDITEGISLKGTRQLHFLEVPISSAWAEQIIARTVRYQSHLHLPLHERHVHVHYWCYSFSLLDFKVYRAARENWHHNFSELHYHSRNGRIQVDENAFLKEKTPDQRAYMQLNTFSKQIRELKEHVKKYCIESQYITEESKRL